MSENYILPNELAALIIFVCIIPWALVSIFQTLSLKKKGVKNRKIITSLFVTLLLSIFLSLIAILLDLPFGRYLGMLDVGGLIIMPLSFLTAGLSGYIVTLALSKHHQS